MRWFERAFKTTVAISLLLSVAVLGTWGQSYRWKRAVQYCRRSIMPNGARQVWRFSFDLTAGSVTISQGTVLVPSWVAEEYLPFLLKDYPNGWLWDDVERTRVDRRSAVKKLHFFDNGSSVMTVFNVRHRDRSFTFPAWVLLVIVSLPADIAG